MGTVTITIIVAGVLAIVLLAAFGGGLVNKLLPDEPLQVGDQVEIFLDGVYNRTATITGVTADRIYIYDTLPLPLGYRGKFYAMGYDIDGVEFWYLRNRKRNNLVIFAECVRKAYKMLSDPYNLEPVTSDDDLITAAQKQMADAEQLKKEAEESSKEEAE